MKRIFYLFLITVTCYKQWEISYEIINNKRTPIYVLVEICDEMDNSIYASNIGEYNYGA